MTTKVQPSQPTTSPKPRRLFKPLDVVIGLVLLAIPLWIWLITPQLLRLPDNFRYQAEMTSVDNPYSPESQDYRGEQYSRSTFSYDTLSREGSTLSIRNTFDVKSETGAQIYKVAPVYAINALTGQHVAGGDQNREGYLFGPRFVRKDQTFINWQASGNSGYTMKFASEEALYGIKVYKFTAQDDAGVDQTAQLSFLPEVGKTLGIKLKKSVNLWIEPTSGWLVKFEDYSNDYYYFDLKTGQKVRPYNQFRNVYAESAIQNQAAIAATKRNQVIAMYLLIPIMLGLLAILLILIRVGVIHPTHIQRARFLIPLSILIVFVILSYLTYSSIDRSVHHRLKLELDVEAQKIQEQVQERTSIYSNIIRSGKAYFDAAKSVSRTEWKRYYDAFPVAERYPGIVGIGYTKFLQPAEVPAFVDSVRKEGFPNFTITPSGQRDTYTAITYLEPFNESNQRAFGFDMLSESVRRRAMLQARDSGDLTATGKVTLKQNDTGDAQAGFLIYAPHYKTGLPASTPAERAIALDGYVYAPFQIKKIIESLFQDTSTQLVVKIYDGLERDADSLIYNSNEQTSTNITPLFVRTSVVNVANHPWTLEFTNRSSSLGSTTDKLAAPMIGTGILLIGLLLASLSFNILRSREKALAYARKLTQDLERSRDELDQHNRDLAEKLKQLDATNRYMVNRELKMIELKRKLEALEERSKQQ